ncbi:unnamed protein product [Auanema sp. JU1783]|nr:unnamed protein product [Auanema sp. JU1783]
MNLWYLRHLGCLLLSLLVSSQLGSTEESVYLLYRQSHKVLRAESSIEENNNTLIVAFKLLAAGSDGGEVLSADFKKNEESVMKLSAYLKKNELNISVQESGRVLVSTKFAINLAKNAQVSIKIDNDEKLLECKYDDKPRIISYFEEPLNYKNVTEIEVVLGSRNHDAVIGCVSLTAIGTEFSNSKLTAVSESFVAECGHDQTCEARSCGNGRCIDQHIAVCDCYETGKSGTSCEKDAVSIELNNAGEGLEDNIYLRGSSEPIWRFAMQFKLKGSNEGVLAYAALQNRDEMKIYVVDDLGTVSITPNITIKFELSTERMFHKLELLIDKKENGLNSKLVVDGVEQQFTITSDLILQSVSYGAGPAEEGVSDAGFTGCFRELYVNEYDVIDMAFMNNPKVVLTKPATECTNHGPTSDSIVVNSVKLIPPEDAPTNEAVLMSDDTEDDDMVSTTGKEPLVLQCENMQKTFCKNEAGCLVINGKANCICQPGYAGSYCQFVVHPRTCAEARSFFHQRDGPTVIDLDGSSNLKFSVTTCEDGSTIVPNSMPPNTLIRSGEEQNWIFRLSYLDFLETNKLSTLIAESGNCQQSVKYECNRAPLKFHDAQTYFRVATMNQTVTQIGRDNGTCKCHDFHNCLHDGSCNCDAFGIAQDDGILTGTQAGITEIISMSISGSVAGRMTVGPLNCSGFAGERDSFQFSKDAELAFTDIRDVSQISLQFKTSVNSGIILTVGPTVLELLDAYTIRVVQGEKSVVLGSQTKLNNSIWHLLRLEWLYDDFLVSVDSHFMVSTEIKKYPDHLVINSLERGFYGCVRSVSVNRELLELEKFARERKLDYKQCSEHCSHISCQNEAECIEDYQKDEATCRCVYPDIQSGATCEIDINHQSSVSFHGGYLTYENITNPLTENTVFSFRTDQPAALLFYAHDHLRNFIQIHLRDEVNLTLTLNRDREIYSCTISASNGDEFSHMQWIQIAIKHVQNDYTQLLVKDEACIIRAPLQLSTSLITQYNNWNTNDGVELPIGLDASAVADPTMKVLVGGVTDVESEDEVVHKLRPSYRTKLPNLLGCVRGLRIGTHSIDMRDRSLGLSPEDPSLVRVGCEVGCDTLTCYNGGHCSIGWRNYDPSASKTKCDCTRTSYVGESCTDDNGMLLSNQIVDFNITSLMTRFVDPPLRGQSLKFAFSPAAARIHSRQVLAVLQSQDKLLEILLNKNSTINVGIVNGKYSQVLNFKGNFTDGYRHFFVARFGPNIATSIMIDSSRQSFEHHESSFMDMRFTNRLIVGGKGSLNMDFSPAGIKRDYEGCISNLELNVGEGTKSLEFNLMDRLDEAASEFPIQRGHCSSFRIPNQPPVLQNTVNLPIFQSVFSREILQGVPVQKQQSFTILHIIIGIILFILFVLLLVCLVCCCRRCNRRGHTCHRRSDHTLVPVMTPVHETTTTKFDIPEPEGDLLLRNPSQKSGKKDCWVEDESSYTNVSRNPMNGDSSPRYLNRFWNDTGDKKKLVPVPTPFCPTAE